MPKLKRSKKKTVKPVIRIFCEGEKTEPNYLNGFINSLRSSQTNRVHVQKTKNNTPIALVDEAIKHKEDDSIDVYWVVYDRESVNKYKDELHAEARQKADANNINIAFSNVCFEFWILLHFIDTTAPYEKCDTLITSNQFRNTLSDNGITDYDKGSSSIFDKLKEKIHNAESRSYGLRKQMKKEAETHRNQPHHINPYIDVDKLLMDIRIFVDEPLTGTVQQWSKNPGYGIIKTDNGREIKFGKKDCSSVEGLAKNSRVTFKIEKNKDKQLKAKNIALIE